ncbi:hypothetical protein [Streptomyces sp. NPDC047097]|uniref:hypothetical protein n=1 Tax=Streptomyces sp. NPDC047097 TaxID=3155260 RepID=UPI0033D8E796
MAASSHQIADSASRIPAALRRHEQQTAAATTRPLAAALKAAQNEAVQHWVRAAGARQTTPVGDALKRLVQAIRDLVTRAFTGAGKQAQRDIERAAFNAAQQSAQRGGAVTTAMRGEPTPPVMPTIGPEAADAAAAVPDAVAEEEAGALALLTTAALTALGLAGITRAFGRARRALTRITRALAVATTSAAAHAVRAIAATINPATRLLWVAEPGACPACAAYAGRSVRPGQQFPGGLSLDPRRTRFPEPITAPPRHPHCRCVVIPWSPDWRLDGTPLPTLLRQHARTGAA